MKKNILIFLLGAISGVIAYFIKSDYLLHWVPFIGFTINIDFNKTIAMYLPYLPWFIFGLFSVFFMWTFTKSYKKTILWFVMSGLSYIIAILWGFGLGIILDILNVKFTHLILYTLVFTISGILGALTLLITYRIGLGRISSIWFKMILALGWLIPGILVPVFGISSHGGGGYITIYEPSMPYELVMMVIWQGFMLLAFVRLLDRQKESNNSPYLKEDENLIFNKKYYGN